MDRGQWETSRQLARKNESACMRVRSAESCSTQLASDALLIDSGDGGWWNVRGRENVSRVCGAHDYEFAMQ